MAPIISPPPSVTEEDLIVQETQSSKPARLAEAEFISAASYIHTTTILIGMDSPI